MNIIYDLNRFEGPLKNPVLTIGNFDGVHMGHLVLFEKVKERARAIEGQSAVMTFEPHPIKIMKPGNGPPLITPTEQKLPLIGDAGVDVIFCLSFTPEFAIISAEDFIEDILIRQIGIKELVVGYDYTFGYKRLGNIHLLRKMGEEIGFKVLVVEPIHISEHLVSSTAIRKLVQEGKLSETRELLGRDYQISGTVIKGKDRGGKLLGFPTANLELLGELIPKVGIYAVTVNIDDRTFYGVTNIGYNPTFEDNTLSVETHIFKFSGDLVGKTIKVNFFRRLRDEKPFPGIKELADQIARDIEQTKDFFQISRGN